MTQGYIQLKRGMALMGSGERVIYASVGLLLLGGAGHILVNTARDIVSALVRGDQPPVVPVLDHLLLVLMLAEIVHTVRTSLAGQALSVEPFLVIGLISGIRRVLVVTAEQPLALAADPSHAYLVLMELALIAGLSLVFLLGLVALRRTRPERRPAPGLQAPEETPTHNHTHPVPPAASPAQEALPLSLH